MLRQPVPRSCPRVALLAAVVCALGLLPAAASARYSFDVAAGNATVTGDAAGDTLAIGVEPVTSTLSVLEHDRHGKDPGLASAIDWDSDASGTQAVRNSSAPTVTISAGGGGDVVALGGTSEKASDLAVGFSIDMGTNSILQPDVIGFANRLGSARSSTFGRDGTGAFVNGFGRVVRHTGAERLSVAGSSGNDSVLVQRLAERLTVNGNGGADTTTFDAATSTAVTGPISVSDVAQTGVVNRLVADGAAASSALTMTLRGEAIVAGGTTASYAAGVKAEVRSGPGTDTIRVEGTSATARPLVSTGGGGDVVQAGSAGSLAGLEDLELDMGTGTDRLDLDDSLSTDTQEDLYVVGAGTLSRLSGPRQQDVSLVGSLAGGGVDTLQIAASGARNRMIFDTASAAFTTHATTGAGDDELAWRPNPRLGTLAGGEGRDELDLSRFTAGVTANLRATAIAGAASVGGFEDLTGGPGPDTLTGLAGAPGSVLRGAGGLDVLIGGEGDDELHGGPGNDGAAGHGGADRFLVDSDGSDGEQDGVDGGAGTDTVAIRGSGSGDVFVARESPDADLPLRVENVSSAPGADTGAVDAGGIDRVELDTFGGEDVVEPRSDAPPVEYDVDGGDGGDELLGGPLDDDVLGGDGGDEIAGGDGDDALDGGDEGDEMRGGPGSDIVQGGAGLDIVRWAAADGAAADAIDGGPESDSFAFTGSDGRDVVSVQPGSGLHEVEVHGSAGAPTTQGLSSVEAVSFRLLRGDDELGATQSPATGPRIQANGDEGDDTLAGGPLGDTLLGQEDDDTLRGSAGDDLLEGRGGADFMSGGTGTDRVDYRFNEGTTGVTVDQDNVADDGNATDVADGGAGTARDDVRTDVEVLFGSTLGDSLTGGPADNVLVGETGPDDLAGGGGTDTVEYSQAFEGVTVDIDGVADDGEEFDEAGGRRDNVALDVENLRGGPGSDTLSGDAGANVLDGAGGPDAMFGREGSDTVTYAGRTGGVAADLDGDPDDGAIAGEGVNQDRIGTDVENLVGGDGPDTLRGDGRANVLDGGPGPDKLHGGDGADTVTYRGRATPVTADLEGDTDDGGIEEGAGRDQIFADVENLTGGDGHDVLTGDGRANLLDGGPGADDLTGGGGTDTATYAARTAGVTVTIGAGADDGSVTDAGEGGRRDDVRGDVENLRGGAGADRLTGSAAGNRFDGGLGGDVLDGAGGRDTVTYAARTAGVTVDLDTQADDGRPGEGDTVLATVERLVGGSGDDSLTGSAGANVLDGGAGADVLSGLGGVDLATYAVRTAAVTVDLDGVADDGRDGEGDNVKADVENLTGGAGTDLLVGNAGDNLFKGGSGPDAFHGLGGIDTVSYAERTDRVVVDIDGDPDDGGTVDERVFPGVGAIRDLVAPDVENLIGGTDSDRLTGDADANRITSRDAVRDEVFCLDGADVVVADALDFVESPACESVQRP